LYKFGAISGRHANAQSAWNVTALIRNVDLYLKLSDQECLRINQTLQDIPHFVVSAVRRGKISTAGYTRFQLDGKFDRIDDDIDPHWFWLLFRESDCVCATLQSLDKTSRCVTACFDA
jgi:hypothetical protein